MRKSLSFLTIFAKTSLTMTTKNSVLLMVKESPGIDYNSLLNKCSANYSNINSARAALSRTLKDLLVFGLIKRQQNNFFATDKAIILVSSEMKNKLVLKLNQAVNSKKPEEEIDLIVQRLSTLIERAKHDSGLLKTAKGSVDFNISSLKQTEEKILQQLSHLKYIQEVFNSQIKTLCELDFNDTKKTDFKKSKKLVQKILIQNSLKEIIAETPNEQTIKTIEEEMNVKFKKNTLAVSESDLNKFFSVLSKLSVPEKNRLVLFLPPIKINFSGDSTYFSGPFSFINSL